MSFSLDVKKELSEIPENLKNSAKAERFGFLTFSNQTQKEKIDFKISNIDKNNLADVLRGAFLACGNITYPNKSYHLEFCPQNLNDALNLIALIENVTEFKFSPKALRRRKNPVVYLKSSEKIMDFLVFLGAKKSAIKFIESKMMKEVRNYINRTTNFETANISKTANSSARQINAIKKLKNSGNFKNLSQNLKELANLRLENPELSLLKIGEKCNPKISRAGANHRFEKILKISKITS